MYIIYELQNNSRFKSYIKRQKRSDWVYKIDQKVVNYIKFSNVSLEWVKDHHNELRFNIQIGTY